MRFAARIVLPLSLCLSPSPRRGGDASALEAEDTIRIKRDGAALLNLRVGAVVIVGLNAITATATFGVESSFPPSRGVVSGEAAVHSRPLYMNAHSARNDAGDADVDLCLPCRLRGNDEYLSERDQRVISPVKGSCAHLLTGRTTRAP